MKIFTTLSLLLLSFCTSAQDPKKIDSLKQVLKSVNTDKARAKAYVELGLEFTNINTDSCWYYANKTIEFAKKCGDKIQVAAAYNNIGKSYGFFGNREKAIQYFMLSMKESDKSISGVGVYVCAINYIDIAEEYDWLRDYNTSLEYKKKTLYLFQKIKQSPQLVAEVKEYDKSIEDTNYWTLMEMMVYNGIGNSYANLRKNDSAIIYFEKTMTLCNEIGDKNMEMGLLLNISNIYRENKEYEKALKNYRTCLDYARSHKNESMINLSAPLINMAGIYVEQEKYDKAIESLSEAVAYIRVNEPLFELENCYALFERTYRKKRDFEKAFLYNDSSSLIKDRISKTQNSRNIAEMKVKFETSEKEKQIKLLEQENKLKKLEGEKQKLTRNIFIVGFGAVFILALLMFRGYRQKQKTNFALTEKNKIIEEKNKNITDSINYARRIQQAKLPTHEQIQSTFPNSFVLFKPKDIVSGDFYYFATNHRGIFIASADCTGHGVPGAFMSMIGSEKLDDAVAHSADTSEILKQLNIGIKTSLRQTDSDESTRDGMDIALCSVDIENRIVKYAGANRPIWIIRNGQMVVEEIKATKKAIGGFTEDSQHFDSHEIKLQQGDTFYISTDGYADTFGGKEEKKLTTKKFKEILVAIQSKTMQEQEKYLDEFIENWKGSIEQIDDILVIGVRL